MIRQWLVGFIRRQVFFPTIGGAFVNPFYLARAGLARAMREYAPLLGGRLLDVGCGSKPYAELFVVDEYIGLDIDDQRTRALGAADYYYSGHDFPFESATFDSIICNQVLEHVFNPVEFIAEMNRVLKPGGAILLTIPFVWDEHEQPRDYARYSSFGLRSLMERGGFAIEKSSKIAANVSVLFQLFNAYLYKLLPKSPRVHLIVCAVLMGPVSLAGEALGHLLPDNPDLFLDQIVFARKTAASSPTP
jgi:SAM-dependent methyltransferase